MTYFKNRRDAGDQLAAELMHYNNNPQVIIIALPRGGVPIGYEVAIHLNAPLEIIGVKKIGAPMNEELAIGAVTETGKIWINDNAVAALGIPSTYVSEMSQKKLKEAKEKAHMYRGMDVPFPNLAHNIAIIVDDGIATGATVRAAVASAKDAQASRIVVAAPVIAPEIRDDFEEEVDEVVYVHAPVPFGAVGDFYSEFDQVPDEEVVKLLQEAREI